MKKVSLFATAILTTAASWASAQAPVAVAGPVPVANPCPCPKAFQGFHLGGNVGYGVGYAKERFTILNDDGTEFGTIRNTKGVRGFDGGLNVGYTHRFGNVGLGLEGVFNWATTKGQFQGPFFSNITDKLALRNSIQVRANLSYVICNLVAPKIILGWDNSEWRRTLSEINGDTFFTNKKRYNSFLWGAGVDFLLAKHVIAGIEYTGTIAGSKTVNVVGGVPAIPNTFSARTQPQYNRFALVIKFIY